MTAVGTTVRGALVTALRDAARFNANDQAAPAAVLWADPNREWATVVPLLAGELPILTLGAYDPASRTGPAIWLRCAIDGTIDGLDMGDGTPIVYLPGLDSNTFRSAASVQKDLEPLMELRYRGVVFRHQNGRDWTARGFLTSIANVSVREDKETSSALQAALEALLAVPVTALRQKAVLDAGYFQQLITPDAVRELLTWMGAEDAEVEYLKQDTTRWRTFRDVAKATYGIDPERDGPLSAAERFITSAATTSDPWNEVWERFCEAPIRYPRLPYLLRCASPDQGALFGTNERSPNDNQRAEEELRQALLSLTTLTAAAARQKLHALEEEHGHRRAWVWAELGHAPLAKGLSYLVQLLDYTAEPLGGGSPSEIADRYAAAGWQADRAVLHALAIGQDSATSKALMAAVNAVYRPWLEDCASTFQVAVKTHGLPARPAEPEPPSGTCVLFTDGLRFDVSNDLATTLRDRGHEVTLEHALGPVPGITASAKPAVSPARADLAPGSEFNATYEGTGVNANVLRRAIGKRGFQILEGEETGDPSGAGWMEYGNLDAIGHAEGAKLAHRVEAEVRALASRIDDLLAAGWREVVVITDHGWLVLPGGLPSVSLPQHLTAARKGRCARLKGGAKTEHQTVPWVFDTNVAIAVAPGIAVFVSGNEYEHGGLSPQESVLPVLRIRAVEATTGQDRVTWEAVEWTGLRVRVDVAGAPAGSIVDLRTKAADASTSIASGPKPVDTDGKASLVVPDDDHFGTAAFLVLIDASGRMLLQRNTEVGDR